MLLPMLDLGLDGSERIRPAVIKDHLNKEMTMAIQNYSTDGSLASLTFVLKWLC